MKRAKLLLLLFMILLVSCTSETKIPTFDQFKSNGNTYTMDTSLGKLKFVLLKESFPKNSEIFSKKIDAKQFENVHSIKITKNKVIQFDITEKLNSSNLFLDEKQSKPAYNFKGAIGVLKNKDGKIGQSIYIVINKSNKNGKLDNVDSIYENFGGLKELDGKFIVIGQIIEGFEIIDKINEITVDENNIPLEEMKINNISK